MDPECRRTLKALADLFALKAIQQVCACTHTCVYVHVCVWSLCVYACVCGWGGGTDSRKPVVDFIFGIGDVV